MWSSLAVCSSVLSLLSLGSSEVAGKTEQAGCGCSAKREPNFLESLVQDITPSKQADQHQHLMVHIDGGVGYMGTDRQIIKGDGEGPRREVTMSPFMIDKYEVANDDFQAFVTETGFITEAETFGWSFVFHTALPDEVIQNITSAVLGAEWWLPVNGSYWKYPEGPAGGSAAVLRSVDPTTLPPTEVVRGTDVFSTGRGSHAVVQVSWNDAVQYCAWRGARLPTEAEWEFAARGPERNVPLSQAATPSESLYPWGDKLFPNKTHRANIYQGKFPTTNTAVDGYEFVAPVDEFPPQNGYGVHNMVGNVWEWVSDWYTTVHSSAPQTNPTGPAEGMEKVKKGGSFLCHKSYCFRYRTVARFPSTPDSGTYNIGFRCAKSVTDEGVGVTESRSEEL